MRKSRYEKKQSIDDAFFKTSKAAAWVKQYHIIANISFSFGLGFCAKILYSRELLLIEKEQNECKT